MPEPRAPREDPRPESRMLHRVRRWARRTPNGEAALAMIAMGGGLIVVAVLLVIFAL